MFLLLSKKDIYDQLGKYFFFFFFLFIRYALLVTEFWERERWAWRLLKRLYHGAGAGDDLDDRMQDANF